MGGQLLNIIFNFFQQLFGNYNNLNYENIQEYFYMAITNYNGQYTQSSFLGRLISIVEDEFGYMDQSEIINSLIAYFITWVILFILILLLFKLFKWIFTLIFKLFRLN